MARKRLLQRLDAAWRAFLASCAGLTESEMLEPGVTGEWSVKDIIAHVTSWEEEALAHLPTILEGGRPPRYSVKYGGIDAFNAQTLAQKRPLPLAEVLRQGEEVHRRLIAYLETVAEEQFAAETRFRRRLRLDTYQHYAIHARAIREWREGR